MSKELGHIGVREHERIENGALIEATIRHLLDEDWIKPKTVLLKKEDGYFDVDECQYYEREHILEITGTYYHVGYKADLADIVGDMAEEMGA